MQVLILKYVFRHFEANWNIEFCEETLNFAKKSTKLNHLKNFRSKRCFFSKFM